MEIAYQIGFKKARLQNALHIDYNVLYVARKMYGIKESQEDAFFAGFEEGVRTNLKLKKKESFAPKKVIKKKKSDESFFVTMMMILGLITGHHHHHH